MRTYPVVLSGGSGTRLWPLSRELYPKQLLALAGEQTMLQNTVARVPGGLDTAAPVVVCNEEHRFLVAEQLRELQVTANGIILEPIGRNTAPALTLAALRLQATAPGEDAVMLVMPADHVIGDIEPFHQAVAAGRAIAESGALVTFGIVPTTPETGYGYIEQGDVATEGGVEAFAVKRFVEKPDAQTAREYLDGGRHLWNSGMFMMRASVWLQTLERLHPELLNCCRRAMQAATADEDFVRVDPTAFESCASDSIDYAVMEPISVKDPEEGFPALRVLPLDARWSDVGAWPALWNIRDKDENGNVAQGDVYSLANRNSLVHADHRFVAALGLDEVIVVETADAVLVSHKGYAQEIKRVVEWLKENRREERSAHRRVFRPWGSYECIDEEQRFKVKRITVKPGASLSRQMHYHRAEHWIVVKGTAKVTCGDKEMLLAENQSTYIPLGTEHRLENPGNIELELVEVQSGSYLGEDDIVRFEDQYGR